jgi:hypothetical protein
VNLDDLMSQIPIGDLAAQLGVSDAEAEEAVKAALPALLGGMQANAQDPAGAASLEHALTQHDGSLLEGGVDLAQVDTDDGRRSSRTCSGTTRALSSTSSAASAASAGARSPSSCRCSRRC